MHTKLLIFFMFALLFIGCPKEDEPCLTCPPPDGNDSLVIAETFITEGIHPAISPDGKKLAFSINGDIYTCDTTGLKAKQLTSGIEYDGLPQWHPDGSHIGFVRTNHSNSNTGVLCTVDTNRTNATILIHNYYVADSLLLESAVTAPIWNWSPDGSKIAFLSIVDRITYLRIFTYPNASEIKSIPLYDDNSGAISHDYSGFSFSPSGNQILFIKEGDSYFRYLFKSTTDIDTTIQQLSNDLDAIYPLWTNYEEKISHRHALRFVILSDNGQFIKESIGNVGSNPKWSPGGKYVLSEVTSRIGGANGYEYSTLILSGYTDYKYYRITNEGDINTHNYFYTWNPDSNIVYYQKQKSIYKITFH